MKKRTKRTQVHVVPDRKSRRWFVKVNGRVNDYLAWPYLGWPRKRDAVAYAVDLAKYRQPSTLKIHKRDGTIQEERTYPRSSDPRRTKG